jgi:RHS repeat-associated protein
MELDEDKMLYYFGARYYDPKTDLWQSPDPILDQYVPNGSAEFDLPGMGGVYNSRSLSVYAYAAQNPVTYIDYEGRSSSFSRASGFARRRMFFRWTQRPGSGQEAPRGRYQVSMVVPGLSFTWASKSAAYSHTVEVAFPGVKFIRSKLLQPKDGKTHDTRLETFVHELVQLITGFKQAREEAKREARQAK